MESTYSKSAEQLRKALKEMLSAIEGGRDNIADLVRNVDQCGQAVLEQAPPMLRHYIERRSYTKALDFLEGRDESGAPNC
ncbi:MAG: hypothetical protein VX670_06400 [Candidatus Latescibacterota bacterium]|nr:hypothetical protein [Candidatus Latescibacterota bacterium]